MKDVSDLAIVLKAIAYEDRHQIVTVITRTRGKIVSMARNSIQSKRFGASLDTFCASQMHWNEKTNSDFFLLKEAHVKYTYAAIKKDYNSYVVASVLSEVLSKVAPTNEPCEELFRLHSNALKILENPLRFERHSTLMSVYFLKVLQWSGNRPQTEFCLDCKKDIHNLDENVTFVIPDAGWICSSCKHSSTRNLSFGYTIDLTVQEVLYLHICFLFSIQDYLKKSTDLDGLKQLELSQKLFCYHMPGFDLSQMKSFKLFEALFTENNKTQSPGLL